MERSRRRVGEIPDLLPRDRPSIWGQRHAGLDDAASRVSLLELLKLQGRQRLPAGNLHQGGDWVGKFSFAEAIEANAEGPPVCRGLGDCSLENLWGQEGKRSKQHAVGSEGRLIRGLLPDEAKIHEYRTVGSCPKDVCWLDVSMHQTLAVDLLQSLGNGKE
jgi:hypothetical protein